MSLYKITSYVIGFNLKNQIAVKKLFKIFYYYMPSLFKKKYSQKD